MNPTTWLIGLVLPAYGFPAAESLPIAVVQDIAARPQAHHVARSSVFNFLNLITVHVTLGTPVTSSLVMYSRSIYGRSDLGVNHKRVETWLAAKQIKVTLSSER
jgi:uncharacterized protein (DUF1499 family)